MQLTSQLPAVGERHRYLGARRRPIERDLEPPNRAAVLEQNERLAERQDGDVEIPIVVVVGDCAAPRDELAHSMHARFRTGPASLGKEVAEHLDPLRVTLQVRDRDVAVHEHEVEVRVVVESAHEAPSGGALEVDPGVCVRR